MEKELQGLSIDAAPACPLDGARRRALRRLGARAVRETDHYARLFAEASLAADGLDGMEALRRLPVLTRAALREHLGAMTSRRADPSRLRHRRTSGSTGHPLFLPVTAAEERWKTWLWLKVYGRWGLRPWHRQAKLLHPSLQPRPRLPQRMGLYRRFYASTEAPPADKVDWLKAVRPDALFAWASLLGEMAIELERRGESVGVPLIFSTSDCLWPGLRDRVARCLRGRLVDLYGAEETGPIAWECPTDGGYHVCTGNVVLELLDDDGRPASRGRVVCTVLWRRTVPLIRYDLGDLAEWAQAPCRCGLALPRLARLHGREQDLVRMPDGRWISIGTFESVLYGLREIRQFQLERTGPAAFTLRIVADGGWGGDEEREVLRRFRERFGDDLALTLLRCDEIARRPGEKFRPFVVLGGRRTERSGGAR